MKRVDFEVCRLLDNDQSHCMACASASQDWLTQTIEELKKPVISNNPIYDSVAGVPCLPFTEGSKTLSQVTAMFSAKEESGKSQSHLPVCSAP